MAILIMFDIHTKCFVTWALYCKTLQNHLCLLTYNVFILILTKFYTNLSRPMKNILPLPVISYQVFR